MLTRSELRAADDRTLSGTQQFSARLQKTWVASPETIRKGAFARAISSRQDVRCTIDHDYSRLLGRTKSRTLSLSEDDHGLKFKCSLPIPVMVATSLSRYGEATSRAVASGLSAVKCLAAD